MTSRSTTLENLPAGTGYQVRVRAVSDVGTGPYSDMRTQITPRGMNVTTSFDVFRSAWGGCMKGIFKFSILTC